MVIVVNSMSRTWRVVRRIPTQVRDASSSCGVWLIFGARVLYAMRVPSVRFCIGVWI